MCECVICHHWYFLNINFRFQSEVCHDLMQKAMSFNDAAMASVKGNDYKVQFWYMSKLESINVLRNADLTKKSGTFQNVKTY